MFVTLAPAALLAIALSLALVYPIYSHFKKRRNAPTYSPHKEAASSLFGGLGLHLLAFGGLLCITGITCRVDTPVLHSIAPGSTAAQLGFLPGDQITAVNGVAFCGLGQLGDALLTNSAFTVTVQNVTGLREITIPAERPRYLDVFELYGFEVPTMKHGLTPALALSQWSAISEWWLARAGIMEHNPDAAIGIRLGVTLLDSIAFILVWYALILPLAFALLPYVAAAERKLQSVEPAPCATVEA